MEEQEKNQKKSLMVASGIGYIFVLFASFHYAQFKYMYPDEPILQSVIGALMHMLQAPFELGDFYKAGLSIIFAIIGLSILYAMIVLYCISDIKAKSHESAKTAKGSASWNHDFKGFRAKYTLPKVSDDPDESDKNLILGKDLYYGLKQGRNVNVTIMGSAGSGKSFGVIKPNLLQMNSSFVVTDPSGEIFRAQARTLLEHGYTVKIFSTSNMAHSNCYNPFDYVYDEEGKVDETRVSSMINMFLQNATEGQNNKGDKFWDQASKSLLTACALLLLEFYPEESHNMYSMLRLVQKGKTSESRSDDKTELDNIFEKARAQNPDAHCFSSYDTFKLAPAKTANSILISAAVDLNMFNQTKVRNMTSTSYKVAERNLAGQIRRFARDKEGKLIRTDENIDLRTVGDEKTCIFVNIPQADSTYNFLVSMMYSQLFESLYGRAEKLCSNKYMIINNIKEPLVSMIDTKEQAETYLKLYQGAEVKKTVVNDKEVWYIYNPAATEEFSKKGYAAGILRLCFSKESGEKFIAQFKKASVQAGAPRLPWHVQALLDEFSNIGSIPEFPQKLATMRKYEISCMIVLQSLAQLKNRYDKLYSDILSNCDSTIFLGSSDPETCKYISERLGSKTTKVQSRSHSTGGKSGGNISTSLDKRELATQDEVSRLDKTKSIVLVAGERPFLVDKYKALDHPNWKYSGDSNREFNIEPDNYVDCREKELSKKGQAAVAANEINSILKKNKANATPIENPNDVAHGVGAATSRSMASKIAARGTAKANQEARARKKAMDDWMTGEPPESEMENSGLDIGKNVKKNAS